MIPQQIAYKALVGEPDFVHAAACARAYCASQDAITVLTLPMVAPANAARAVTTEVSMQSRRGRARTVGPWGSAYI